MGMVTDARPAVASAPAARAIRRPANAGRHPLCTVRLAGTRVLADAAAFVCVTKIEIESRSHGGLVYAVEVTERDWVIADATHVMPEGADGPVCAWARYGHADCRHVEAATLALLLSRELGHVRSLRSRYIASRFAAWYLPVIDAAEVLCGQYQESLAQLGFRLGAPE